MELVVFGWRCIKHPRSGGSEAYIFNILWRIRKYFDRVLYFTSYSKGLRRKEDIGGIEVYRMGYDYVPVSISFYARAVLRRVGWTFDRDSVIIENINHVPFFTPVLFRGVPVVAIIHHIGGVQLYEEASFPVAKVVDFVERRLTPALYREFPVVTVSESSKEVLRALGYRYVHVIPPGIGVDVVGDPNYALGHKGEPIIVYFGRIMRYKRVHDAVAAFSIVKKEFPGARMYIAGRISSPRYFAYLRSYIRRLGLERSIMVLGEVTEEEKRDLLLRAQVLVLPSLMEGWEICAVEANACGTPVVAYDVPGLRDSVRHMETGILVRPMDVNSLAEAIKLILADDGLRRRLSEGAIRWARNFSWDMVAEKFLEVLKGVIER